MRGRAGSFHFQAKRLAALSGLAQSGPEGSFPVTLRSPSPTPTSPEVSAGLNFNPEQSGFSSVSGAVPPLPLPLGEGGVVSQPACVHRCPLGPSTPGWGRTQKSPVPFPHPQVCCKQPDPAPRRERVLPDSWAFPHVGRWNLRGSPGSGHPGCCGNQEGVQPWAPSLRGVD